MPRKKPKERTPHGQGDEKHSDKPLDEFMLRKEPAVLDEALEDNIEVVGLKRQCDNVENPQSHKRIDLLGLIAARHDENDRVVFIYTKQPEHALGILGQGMDVHDDHDMLEAAEFGDAFGPVYHVIDEVPAPGQQDHKVIAHLSVL
jgi:hypothetical protein